MGNNMLTVKMDVLTKNCQHSEGLALLKKKALGRVKEFPCKTGTKYTSYGF
jgi:hypothetical protein